MVQGQILISLKHNGFGHDTRTCAAERVEANYVKSQWVPVQSGDLLGYVLNLHVGTFQVPQRRVEAFHHVLRDVIAHKFVVSARTFTGRLASMTLALGPLVRLWTRSLYPDILQAVSLHSPFQLSADA